jgi:hypothetical protein
MPTSAGSAVLSYINPLNTELNPICKLLALLGAHPFLYVSRARVNITLQATSHFILVKIFPIFPELLELYIHPLELEIEDILLNVIYSPTDAQLNCCKNKF